MKNTTRYMRALSAGAVLTFLPIGGGALAQTCSTLGTDCSAAFFDTPAGQAEWNLCAGDSTWPCESSIETQLDAVEAGPDATTGVDSTEPYELYDSQGLVSTQLANPTTVTELNEVEPVRTSEDYVDVSATLIPLRSLEAATHEANGKAIATCREFAFHAWQDWAELNDRALQDDYSNREFLDAAFLSTLALASTSTTSQPWGPTNPYQNTAADRDGHPLPAIPWSPRARTAVLRWDPIAQQPAKNPATIPPSFEDHFERNMYAQGQGWTDAELDALWERQKDLHHWIGVWSAAEIAKMEAIIEDLVRGGGMTPQQAWNDLDQRFMGTNPTLESIHPARCKYVKMVELASSSSPEFYNRTLATHVLSNGPEPSLPANGGDLGRTTLPGMSQLDHEMLLGFPKDYGDADFDVHYNAQGPLVLRNPQLYADFGPFGFQPGPSDCDALDDLISASIPAYDFTYNPLAFRLNQANQTKIFARQQIQPIYNELAAVCPPTQARTKCDWAPAAFRETVVRHFEGRIEREESRCLERTEDQLANTDDFFSVYPTSLMSQFLNANDPAFAPASDPSLAVPPPHYWTDYQRFLSTDYTDDVTTFRGLYADMDLYAIIVEFVRQQGLRKMANEVASNLSRFSEGQATHRRSLWESFSKSTGEIAGSNSFDSYGDFVYPDAVSGNYNTAFGQGTGFARVGFKNNSEAFGFGSEMVDLQATAGPDTPNGPYPSQSRTAVGSGNFAYAKNSQFLGQNAPTAPTKTVPITFSLKSSKTSARLSLAKATGIYPNNQLPLVELGPIRLYAEVDVELYTSASLELEILAQGATLFQANGLRFSHVGLAANTGVEGFIAVAVEFLFVSAGIKAALTFVDFGAGVDFIHERKAKVFNNKTEADALLPNLGFMGRCDHSTTPTRCAGLNLWKRGGLENSVVSNREHFKLGAEVSGLKFALKAFVKIGFGPFSFTIEAILARTSGMKFGSDTVDQEEEVNLIAMVACDEALDMAPSGWDKAACQTEDTRP